MLARSRGIGSEAWQQLRPGTGTGTGPPTGPSPDGPTSTDRCTTSTSVARPTARCSSASTGSAARPSTGRRWRRHWPQTCRVVAIDLAGFGHTLGGSRSTSVAGEQPPAPPIPRRGGRDAGDPGRQLDGRADLDPPGGAAAPRRSPGSCSSTRHCHPRCGPAPTPGSFATFAAFMVPVVGPPGGAPLRGTRSSAEQAARDLLRLCCADPDRIPPEIVDLHAELAGQRLEYPDVDSEMLTAAQSLALGARRPAPLRRDAAGDRRARAAAARRPGPARSTSPPLGPRLRRTRTGSSRSRRVWGTSRSSRRRSGRSTPSSAGSPRTPRSADLAAVARPLVGRG